MHQNILLLRIRHMGIDFRCTDGAMPQHLLDIPDINVLFQQQGGKGMTEHVWGNMLFDAGKGSIVLYHEAHGLVGQAIAQPVDKEVTTGVNFCLPGILISCQGMVDFGIPNLQDAFFRTFSIDKHGVVYQVDIRRLEGAEF